MISYAVHWSYSYKRVRCASLPSQVMSCVPNSLLAFFPGTADASNGVMAVTVTVVDPADGLTQLDAATLSDAVSVVANARSVGALAEAPQDGLGGPLSASLLGGLLADNVVETFLVPLPARAPVDLAALSGRWGKCGRGMPWRGSTLIGQSKEEE